MPLTLNAGAACPSEGVQPRKEGARLAQHTRAAAGDIIKLTVAHSQSLHTVEHGTPPPSAEITPAASCPDSTAGDNNEVQQQLAGSTAFSPSLPSLISRCPFLPLPEVSLFSLLGWNARLVLAWLSRA